MDYITSITTAGIELTSTINVNNGITITSTPPFLLNYEVIKKKLKLNMTRRKKLLLKY